MRINLHEIINIPGASVSFEYEPDFSGLAFDSVKSIGLAEKVRGYVKNAAGILTLSAEMQVSMVCICALCLDEFTKCIQLHIDAILADTLQDEDDPDIFLLDGDYIDLDEVIITNFVLNMEQRLLCKPDCKGLCEKCGKNLNEGPCNCTTKIDPRLTVLGQLLENE